MRSAFPVFFSVGTLAGLAWLLLGDPLRQMPGRWRDRQPAAFLRVDAGLAALAAGLLGARLGYVAAHWGYYGSRPAQALVFSDGGLSWAAGALGAILGMGLLSRLRRAPLAPLADALALPATILAAACWGGCLLDGCAYGRPLPGGSSPLLGSDFFDSSVHRWPTQLVGLLSCCALALGVMALEPRLSRPGTLACLTTVGLGLMGIALSFARGDPVPLLGNVRIDFLGGAVIAAVGLAGWLSLRHRRPARSGLAATD